MVGCVKIWISSSDSSSSSFVVDAIRAREFAFSFSSLGILMMLNLLKELYSSCTLARYNFILSPLASNSPWIWLLSLANCSIF
jgi:hypothetical protein